MKLIASTLLAAALTFFVPAEDSRNKYTPDDNTHFVMPAYSTLSEWEARRQHLKSQILSAAGLFPMPPKNALNPKSYGRLERDGYSIDKILIQTLPGYYLGGNLYQPLHRSGKLPAVLLAHGHWKYGRLQNEVEYSVPALAVNLARQGYVVFAYDMVGYNDTKQTPHSFGGQDEQLWSFSPFGLQLWNSIRSVDYLFSLPNVDSGKIAITGASGGGTQTFMLAAVDERVRFAAPVNMISDSMQGGDPCEDAPGLRFGTFNTEIAAVIAPRRMLIVSSTRDWTKHTPYEEFPAIRKIYELYGKPNRLRSAHVDAPHNYNKESREAVYRFFGEQMLGQRDSSALKDREFQQEEDSDLLALKEGQPPADALNYEALFESWKQMARRQAEAATDRSVVREQLRQALAVEWPTRLASDIDHENVLLSRAGAEDRVGGLYISTGSKEATLVIHPRGAEAARRTPAVQNLLDAGRSVLMIDTFQTGNAHAYRNRSGRYFLTYNRSDDANRVQDILTALAFLKMNHSGPIKVVGLENAAVWCLFAAAVAPIDVALTANLEGFDGSDESFRKSFFVPGVQRAGGLRAARLLTTK
ncbi:MAG: alpha/beta fold hydrolase [Bryobacteraceae bacterium]